jgi:hypothetical protein
MINSAVQIRKQPMISLDQYIPDTFCGPVSKELHSLTAMEGWTAAKHKAKEELLRFLKRCGYIEFSGNSVDYTSMSA